MRRWALTISARHPSDPQGLQGARYELVPGETTIVGRLARDADFAIGDTTLSRRHAAFLWRKGRWHVVDTASANGVLLDGDEAVGSVPTPIAVGTRIDLGRIELRLEEFEAQPLDDAWLLNDWILYGRRRPPSAGRWPAFRRHKGRLQRATVALSIAGDDQSPAGETPPLRLVAVTPRDGVPLLPFLAALDDGDDRHRFAAHAFAQCLDAPPPLGSSDHGVGNVVVTWSGEVRALPGRAPLLEADRLSSLAATPLLDNERFPRERIAQLTRALFADAWRDEVEVSEQLEGLDDDGVRWLLERQPAP